MCGPWRLSERAEGKKTVHRRDAETPRRGINMDLATYRMHEMVGSFSSAEGAERSRMRGFRWRDTISPEFLEEERRVFGDRLWSICVSLWRRGAGCSMWICCSGR